MAETILTPMDAEDVLAQIHASIQSGNPVRPVQVHAGRFEVAPTAAGPFAELQLRTSKAAAEIQARVAQVGGMPPTPATLRGRIGRAIIRALNGVLWWHTRSVSATFEAVQMLSREQLSLAGALAHRLGEALDKQVLLEIQLGEVRRELGQRLGEVLDRQAQLDVEFGEVRRELGRIGDRSHSIQDMLASGTRARELLGGEVRDLVRKTDQVGERVRELGTYMHETRAEISLQSRRLSTIAEQWRTQGGPLMAAITTERAGAELDSMYLAFENLFRGSREEIKARVAVYLPVLEGAGIGGAEMPLVDIGCGRGEWLEVLRDRGLAVRGVDVNSAMVEVCRSHNLDISDADFLEYLRALPDGSLGAVTAFHLIEHLSFPALVSLLDECLRVLKPGGLLILETPNPTNVLVGSHTFYMDPTHIHPLPPAMLRFFVEARGYSELRFLELHPYPEAVKLPDDGNSVARRFNEHFYGAQDYAIIARRP